LTFSSRSSAPLRRKEFTIRRRQAPCQPTPIPLDFLYAATLSLCFRIARGRDSNLPLFPLSDACKEGWVLLLPLGDGEVVSYPGTRVWGLVFSTTHWWIHVDLAWHERSRTSEAKMAVPAAQAGFSPSKGSLRRWLRAARWRHTSVEEARAAEWRLLTHAGCAFRVEDVKCGDTHEHYMHTVVGGEDTNPTLVCTAGYGAGLGFFYRNLSFLTQHFRTFAVDLLGCGLSGRPKFEAKNREEAEDFFVDALEKWRIEQGLEDIILLGHSLGGYLSTCYALKYPKHVKKLILVCPAGVDERPKDYAPRNSYIFKTFRWAWNKGVTPGMIVRFLGPLGPSMCSRYTRSRFANVERGWTHGECLPEDTLVSFSEYMYHVLAQKGSGEHALRHLLAPGAWAHAPLQSRMDKLNIPITFVYGEKDWMNWKAGDQICRSKGEENAWLHRIDKSGHYTFLDRPHDFNNVLTLILQRYQGQHQQAVESMVSSGAMR